MLMTVCVSTGWAGNGTCCSARDRRESEVAAPELPHYHNWGECWSHRYRGTAFSTTVDLAINQTPRIAGLWQPSVIYVASYLACCACSSQTHQGDPRAAS